MIICQNTKCNKEFPTSIIIDGKRRTLNKRKYCLECTPFGSHNTYTIIDGEKFKVSDNNTNISSSKFYKTLRDEKLKTYNWNDIQDFYDSGGRWRDVVKNFKIPSCLLSHAVKLGLLKTIKNRRSNKPSYRHTKESKQKCREARLKYLSEHPEESSWRAVQGKESAPEKFVKDFLIKRGIEFISEFKPLVHKNRYFCMDIAFLNYKIAWEINGGQHYDTNGNLKPYYQKRHDLIENEGWKVIEIHYANAFKEEFLDSLLKMVPMLKNDLSCSKL